MRSSADMRACGSGMSRRSFVTAAGVFGAGAVLAGCAKKDDTASSSALELDENGMSNQSLSTEPFAYDSVVWGGCHVNCGSRCPLKLYVKDGTVVRVSTDVDGSDDFKPGGIYQMRSCLRASKSRSNA